MKRPFTEFDSTINVLRKCSRLLYDHPADPECIQPQLVSLIRHWESKALKEIQSPSTFKQRIGAILYDLCVTKLVPKEVVTNVEVERLWPENETRAPYLRFRVDFGRASQDDPSNFQWSGSSLFSESCIPKERVPKFDFDPFYAHSAYAGIRDHLSKNVAPENTINQQTFEALIIWLVKKKELTVYSTNDQLYNLFDL
jgi:hypothetical protein